MVSHLILNQGLLFAGKSMESCSREGFGWPGFWDLGSDIREIVSAPDPTDPDDAEWLKDSSAAVSIEEGLQPDEKNKLCDGNAEDASAELRSELARIAGAVRAALTMWRALAPVPGVDCALLHGLDAPFSFGCAVIEPGGFVALCLSSLSLLHGDWGYS